MKENRFWMNTINGKIKLDEDLSKITLENLDKAQEELSPNDIKKAAQNFFNAQQRLQIVMEPEDMPNN